ncbi:RNA methyltransferase [Candidatus Uhrbacteria bacterium]|nr:RNA methyltransferase [Candidatus Uhrbacteria bacterium]
MLSKAQERILRDVQTKKGRKERGLFLIEGEKFVREAKHLVEFTFTPRDTNQFREYVTTETPQSMAAVARIPEFSLEDVLAYDTVVVLDGVQDPGNVGTVLRACLGFRAALILVESADPTNPKVVRASTSALLKTPWVEMKRAEAEEFFAAHPRTTYRLEVRGDAIAPDAIAAGKMYLVAGNEGSGISLDVPGTSVRIAHDKALESLNVAVATSIVLAQLYRH